MKVILISGKAGHGKDTAADILKEKLSDINNPVLITHYADLLKFICKSYLGWDGEKDRQGRELLQYVGTELFRKKDPSFWVDFIIKVLKILPPDCWSYVIIPDCRFPNEISRIKEEGFDAIHVRVERDGYEGGLTDAQRAHSSEIALESVTPDYIIKNEGDITALEKNIENFIKEII